MASNNTSNAEAPLWFQDWKEKEFLPLVAEVQAIRVTINRNENSTLLDGTMFPFKIVPFPGGADPTKHPHNLPALLTADILAGLSEEDVAAYCKGYGIPLEEIQLTQPNVTGQDMIARRIGTQRIPLRADGITLRLSLRCFAQYLHTNYVPRDTEVNLSFQTHLIVHTLEVLRFEALIADLSAQREESLGYIGAHEALMSLARRMPQDVMQEVFLACIPRIRNAVMSTKDAHLQELADPRAAYSRALGIPSHPVGEYEYEGVDEALQMLSGCADRWRSVELSFEMTEGLSHLANVYAPALRAVKLCGPEAEVLGLKMLTTPSLREVTLEIFRDFDGLIFQLPLTWNNLTHLTFQTMGRCNFVGLSPNVALEILQRCPRIVSFKSDIRNSLDGSNFPESMPQPTPLILSAIQELVLLRDSSSLNTTSVIYLLHHLFMPQLRQLKLPHTITDQSLLPFLGDLAIRSPLIQSIDMDQAGLTHDSLVETLTGLPVLERLVIVDCHNRNRDDGATVQRLFAFLAQDRQPPVLPLLSEMDLQMCRERDETGLLDVARHLRHRDGSHFQRFKIEYDGWKAPISPKILVDFAAQGLTISTRSVGGVIRSHANSLTPTPWTELDRSQY
ncbi:hypothetical protein DFH06DRAFT_1149841 [Mycena polygramma]|nr:hypothetical protein DFH06DRAFT_1149841 [Mycena polygramma]